MLVLVQAKFQIGLILIVTWQLKNQVCTLSRAATGYIQERHVTNRILSMPRGCHFHEIFQSEAGRRWWKSMLQSSGCTMSTKALEANCFFLVKTLQPVHLLWVFFFLFCFVFHFFFFRFSPLIPCWKHKHVHLVTEVTTYSSQNCTEQNLMERFYYWASRFKSAPTNLDVEILICMPEIVLLTHWLLIKYLKDQPNKKRLNCFICIVSIKI